MSILKPPKKPREQKLARLSPSQRTELERIEADAIADFKGQLDELESALGMLRLGHHMGWKVLYIMHSKSTVRKYERILGGIKIREIFPEVGPSAYRSLGYRIAETASNFWKVVSGTSEEVSIPKHERRAVGP